MSRKVIIATIMREQGETGVQTHFNMFKKSIIENEKEVEAVIITPFSFYKWLVIPVFALRKIIDKLNGELSVWWYRYWHYLFLKQVLIKQLAEHKRGTPVVIYAQCPLSAKAALEARQSDSQKVIMIVHFNISQAEEWADKGKLKKEGRLYKRIKLLENEVLPKVDGIIYVCKFMKSILETNIPEITKVRSGVIPYFIYPSSEANYQEGAEDIINIGTLETRKNQSYLLQVLAEANKMGKHYTLTLVGDGPDRLKLKSLAQSLGIDEQVKFMGFKLNAAQFLPNHRVYAHCAIMETFGISITEAMACGLPVIAGAVGGIPEVFSDKVEGFYWPLDNPTAGAKKLIALMEDKETYNKMSKAAQTSFYNNFAPAVGAKKLLSFLWEDSYE